MSSWDDFRFFLSVARQGGLSPAARELGVNQSTVSRRISQLERRLDARLFDRQARGYALTATGERMLAQAIRVEDEVLALERAVLGADHGLAGTIRITTVMEVLERIAPHLNVFRGRYPGITLELNTDQRVHSLGRREADVAIRPGFAPTEPEVVGRKIVTLANAVYASSAYLAEHGRPTTIADLAGHNLITFPDDRWRRIDGALALPEMRIVVEANTMTAQAIAARAGMGVALLPTMVGDCDPQLERLMDLPDSNTHLWLLIHADLRQTARVRALVDFLTDAIRADSATFDGTASIDR